MQSVKKFNIKEGINLYYINDTKYKTVSMAMYLHRELNRAEVTFNSLLTKVLRNGNSKYNSIKSINTYLESLYGTLFSIDVSKKADIQSISCSVSNITDRFSEDGVTSEAAKLMLELMFEPYIVDDAFCAEYVDSEKKNLKDDIEAIINDKRSYANMRCVEEMCKGEKNAILDCGYIEDLPSINKDNLYEHYKKIIFESPIDIYVVGDADINSVVKTVSDYLEKYSFNINPHRAEMTKRAARDVKYVEEKLDVNQGKLSMGFMTQTNADDKNYYALLVGNSIFGSGAHSKLFNNVREKMSLAYYASSRLDKFNSLMIVSSGIEFKNYEKAKNEILLQLEAVKNGDFTEDELSVAKEFIINSYKSYLDSPYLMREFYLTSGFTKDKDTLETVIEKVLTVTKEQITDVFSKVSLDTVYFLKGKDCE